MSDAESRQPDPRVEQLRPDPSQPASRAQTLVGLWGNSDRPGFRRLYFTTALDSYAEFRVEDVLGVEDIPEDRSPFLGEQATRATLRHDAPVDITRSRRIGAVDEFDIDVRFGRISSASNIFGGNFVSCSEPCIKPATGLDDTCQGTCDTQCGTCFGDNTCSGATCPQCVTDFCRPPVRPRR